jgi:hypothetical protein
MARDLDPASRPWIKRVARVGYATKGIVYLIVGGLALFAAVGHGGRVAGTREAVKTIGEQPFGEMLLIAAGFGLAAYAAWCLLQAVFALTPKRGMKRVAKRIAWTFSGGAYATLALTAFQLALGRPEHEGGTRTWVALIMANPFGQVLIGAAGIAIAAHGALQIQRAISTRFLEDLETSEMSAQARRLVTHVGRIGLIARGIVFGIVAYFLVNAAIDSRPGQARDLGGALREIALQPHGKVLLAAIAVGLAAYGTYALISARYARLMV